MSDTGFKFQWQRAFMASTLPPVARHVLHALGAFMAEDGTRCFPSIDTLATATGLCEKAVRKNIQQAERAGWIRRWERRASGQPLAGRAAQGWRHYQYAPNIPEPTTAPAAAHATERDAPPIDRTLTPNVRYVVPHLDPERAVSGSPNVRYVVPPINQVISQEKTKNQCVGEPPTEPTKTPPPNDTQKNRLSEKNGKKYPLPDNWQMPEEWRAIILDHRPHIDVDGEVKRFVAHYDERQFSEKGWKSKLAYWFENAIETPDEKRRAAEAEDAERWRRLAAKEQAEREQREAEEAAKKAASERRRAELAPLAEKVKLVLAAAPRRMTGRDVLAAADCSLDDLEDCYFRIIRNDPEVVGASLRLHPDQTWTLADAEQPAAEAEQDAPKAQPAPVAATTSIWYDDEPAAPAAAPAAPAAPPTAPVPPPATPAPAPATRCTSAELEDAYSAIEEAGPRGINIADIPNLTHRVLRALLDAGRMRLDGATVTATKFGGRRDEPVPLGAVLHRFNTSTSTTSTVSLTGRAVL